MAAAAAPSSRMAAARVPGQQRGSPPPPAGAPPAAAPPPAAAAPGRCRQYSSATYPAAAAAAGAAGSDAPGAVAAADFGDAWYHPEERQQLHPQPLSKPSKRRPPTQHKPTCLLKPRVALGSNKVPASARWRPRARQHSSEANCSIRSRRWTPSARTRRRRSSASRRPIGMVIHVLRNEGSGADEHDNKRPHRMPDRPVVAPQLL